MRNDTLSLTSALDGVDGQRLASAALPREDLVPMYRRLGGPQRQSGRGTDNLATTGIRFPNRPTRSKCNFYSMYTIYKCDLGSHNKTWRDA